MWLSYSRFSAMCSSTRFQLHPTLSSDVDATLILKALVSLIERNVQALTATTCLLLFDFFSLVREVPHSDFSASSLALLFHRSRSLSLTMCQMSHIARLWLFNQSQLFEALLTFERSLTDFKLEFHLSLFDFQIYMIETAMNCTCDANLATSVCATPLVRY